MAEQMGQRFGNYYLVKFLGRGGFATTYLGENPYLKKLAAIKVLQAQLGPREREDFFHEAYIITHLNHPNIVSILDCGVEEQTPYLVMTYAPNGTLRQFHPKGSILPLSQVVAYVNPLASALQYAHTQKIVHRDIKPENMLFGANHEVLLSDFGIAVIAQTWTQTPQNIAGTVTYMAPEQIMGRPCFASDQYALGIVVYEWLCGMPPFQGSYVEVAMQHEQRQPPPLRLRNATLSLEVEEVVQTALAKAPQQRFSNIQAFANALEHASQRTSPQRTFFADSQLDIPTRLIFHPTPPIQPLPLPTPSNVSQAQSPLTPPHASNPVVNISPNIQPAQSPLTPPHHSHPVVNISPNIQPLPPTVPNIPKYTPPIYSSSPLNNKYSSGRTPISPGMLVFLLLALAALIAGSSLIYVAWDQLIAIQGLATATAQTVPQGPQVTSTAQVNPIVSAPTQGTAPAVATQTAPDNIYAKATSGTPTINDPLNKPDTNGWPEQKYADPNNNNIGSCGFTDGAYRSIALAGYFTPCPATNTNFSNFTYQVEMTILSGSTGGLAVRLNNLSGYYFLIYTNGTYIFYRAEYNDQSQRTGSKTLLIGTNPAIKTGNNQPNVLAIVAQGNNFSLYVNKHYINKVSDSDNHFKEGTIGVVTNSVSGNVTAAFRNAEVWQL